MTNYATHWWEAKHTVFLSKLLVRVVGNISIKPSKFGKMYVRDELYDSYIADDYWSGFRNFIHRLSEFDEEICTLPPEVDFRIYTRSSDE